MNNLEIYAKYAEVPQEAQKKITGGRINGFTDINPMWRIKCLTETYGQCGIGWYTETTKQWLETGANGEVAAFVNIKLYVKVNGEWSMGIEGTGGSSFVSVSQKGAYTSDEAFKMAETDAFSVACKKLGIGANVYWAEGRTKYDAKAEAEAPKEAPKPRATKAAPAVPQPAAQVEAPKPIQRPGNLDEFKTMEIEALAAAKGVTAEQICKRYNVSAINQLSLIEYELCIKALKSSSGRR